MKKYTIKDIAKLAGVSKGTVDRVIHNRGKVSETALKKVNNILKEIDYQPNLIAQSLKNNKNCHLCILMPDPEIDPYWAPCIDGIEEALNEFSPFGTTLEYVYFNPFNKDSFEKQSLLALKSEFDGILLAPLFQKESIAFINACDKIKKTYFLFNNDLKSVDSQKFVGQDLFQSGRIGAKLIHSTLKGNAEVAIIHIDEVFKNATHMQEKEKGFRSYFNELKDNSFSINTYKLKHRNANNLKKTIKYFIDTHPEINGFFVTNSKINLLAALLNNSKKSTCVVGYDLLQENIKYLKSGIIDYLIHQNPKRQAYLGTVFLADYILFNKVIPNKNLIPIDIVNSENYMGYLK
ncbi:MULTISPECIES: LacI family DNA-binding transcriptional regulator [Aestuariivivens]|uniref:LacI family DNA-binding transcriptional regulator n=1 Tax=Aestuariivivens TaxID=1820275 RepID=UPI001CBB52FA|nr:MULTISPECIES: LacI family DNA-binding transcriptional regulator [Aestuariivivens]